MGNPASLQTTGKVTHIFYTVKNYKLRLAVLCPMRRLGATPEVRELSKAPEPALPTIKPGVQADGIPDFLRRTPGGLEATSKPSTEDRARKLQMLTDPRRKERRPR